MCQRNQVGLVELVWSASSRVLTVKIVRVVYKDRVGKSSGQKVFSDGIP